MAPSRSRRGARRASRRPGRGPRSARRRRIRPSSTCALDLAGRQVRPQPRDRLELVERSARVAEPAARQLGDRQPERRRERRERQRHAVGHPAGRVLVDRRAARSPRSGSVSPESTIARVRASVSSSSSPDAEAAMRNAAASVVGDLAARRSPDERPELVLGQRPPVALARRRRRADRRRSRDRRSELGGEARPVEIPRPHAQAARRSVAPRSANVSRVAEVP